MNQIKVKANANIALIKYWGKRDENIFLPTKSSLSVTLSELFTTTQIEKIDSDKDEVFIDQKSFTNILRFLDLFRTKYGIKDFFKIETQNSFPTAAGLASSASGFAALAYGLNKLCNLDLSLKELSILTRQGSGSACRSLHGGFVLWNKSEKPNGEDSFAQQLFDENYWPEFRILVAIVDEKEKQISSRVAMQSSVKTSAFYPLWIKESEAKIPQMIKALEEKDFDAVGSIAEQDCLGMHKTMQTAVPAVNFFQQSTLGIMEKVNQLRSQGISCYFTIDAGPNVKILCLEKDREKIVSSLNQIQGILKVISCKVGQQAQEY